MASSKKPKQQSQITQGGINFNGNVTIKGNVAGRDNVEKKVVNINLSFAPIYQAIKENKTISPKAQKTIEENVKQLEAEIGKGDKAKGSFVQQRLENIQKMAPDIADVVIATLQSPAAGIGVAIKKVVNKIKEGKN